MRKGRAGADPRSTAALALVPGAPGAAAQRSVARPSWWGSRRSTGRRVFGGGVCIFCGMRFHQVGEQVKGMACSIISPAALGRRLAAGCREPMTLPMPMKRVATMTTV